jgi:hypothetical protein
MEVAVCEDSLRNGSICGGGVCWYSDPMTRQQFMRITDYCQIKETVEWNNEYLIDWDSIRMTIGTNLDFERAEEAEYRVDLQLHQ